MNIPFFEVFEIDVYCHRTMCTLISSCCVLERPYEVLFEPFTVWIVYLTVFMPHLEQLGRNDPYH